MRLTPLPSPRMAKSSSVGVLEQESDMHIVDQEDINGLTQDVKNFSDGLARLKGLFGEEYGSDEDLKVLAHERLGDVLCTLKSVLQRYPPLNTTEMFSAAGDLISKIKTFNYEDHNHCLELEGAFSDAIDQLALEFSSSVSEYLMGDLQNSFGDGHKMHKSYDNLLGHDTTDKEDTESEREEPVVHLTAEEIDETLMRLQAGLEMAFQRAKAWSKYLKDVMSYIERRAQLEVEYSKNLSRLAASVKPALTEEGFLPLQSVYCTVLSQDVEYSKTCQATFTLLQTNKFVEPLTSRRNDHDKTRKNVKDTWNKEVKKMQESVNNLRKAQSMYISRQQEYERAKELWVKTESDVLHQSTSSSNLAKVDKKRRAEEEAAHKAAEAETTYKACVAEANSRQADIQKTKAELLAQIREQIFLSDQTIKKVTIDYFQLLQAVSAPVPVQYNTLCEASKRYEAGSQYGEFVRRLPVSTSVKMQYEEFKFEPFSVKSATTESANRKTSTQSNESASSDHQSGEGSPTPRRGKIDKYRVPVNAWSGGRGIVSNSDTDSQSGSSKSLDSSPSNSPYPTATKKMVLTGSMDDLIEDETDVSMGVKQLLAVPGTEQMDVQSIYNRKGGRRNTTFGVSFQEQVEHYHSAIPPIVSKSLKEIERRGITVKGIYRVSGVKSTVENLCQRFENDPESVSLENENPNVISNVLKLYLRQLPDPLLTFKLYPSFIATAKENMSGGVNVEDTVEKIHDLIDCLPFSNRKTCGVLMHHLRRVAAHAEHNKMNASNLGIVFGPTLLRPPGGNASLTCLVDTPHQTRVVELLIVHAESLFGPAEDHQLIPGETMVEAMAGQATTLQVPRPVTVEMPKEQSSARPEVRKQSSPKINMKTKEEDLLTSQLPSSSSSSSSKGPQSQKSDDMILPGSAGLDRKEAAGASQHQEGDEDDMSTTGIVTTSDDSDIPSDDDLLLPDGSLPSQHSSSSRQHDLPRGIHGGIIISKTPPLSSRHGNRPLPSTSSSPNLSVRSAPPTIKIDNSVPDLSASSSSLATDRSAAIQQKVLQLPPVNTWVPKSESIFSSILDSRSPQVYRRTTASSTKTSSYPQSNSQAPGPIKGSRVSWPQRTPSNHPQLSPPTVRHVVSDQQMPQATDTDKSPKLLRKCTSFDIERSRPFPARSTIATSPMLLKKATSVEGENSAGQFQAPKMNKWANTTCLDNDSVRIIHKEEDEIIEEVVTEIDVPQCASESSVMPLELQSSTDTIASGNAGKCMVLSEDTEVSCEFDAASIDNTLQDPNIQETAILNDIIDECEQIGAKKKDRKPDRNRKASSHQGVDNAEQGSVFSSAPDLGAKPKTKSSLIRENVNKKFVKSKSTGSSKDKSEDYVKRKSKDSSASSSSKSDRSSSTSGKSKSKSSVKTALLSSAAKLKAISKKSPVMLLSYKSHSISIPDHTEKPERPSSTSDLPPNINVRRPSGIHQTESSPTVLQGSSSENLLVSIESEGKIPDKMLETSAEVRPKAEGNVKPELSRTSSNLAKCAAAAHAARKNSRPFVSTESSKLHTKTGPSKDKTQATKPKVTVGPDKQGPKTVVKDKHSQSVASHGTKSGTSSKPAATSKVKDATETPKTVQLKSKTQVKKVPGKSKDVLPHKSRLVSKRDSIGSANSDSSKKSDHFHDCCHVRRKPADKK